MSWSFLAVFRVGGQFAVRQATQVRSARRRSVARRRFARHEGLPPRLQCRTHLSTDFVDNSVGNPLATVRSRRDSGISPHCPESVQVCYLIDEHTKTKFVTKIMCHRTAMSL